eukprot:2760716-Pleurochrysis_carterae.AAC.1
MVILRRYDLVHELTSSGEQSESFLPSIHWLTSSLHSVGAVCTVWARHARGNTERARAGEWVRGCVTWVNERVSGWRECVRERERGGMKRRKRREEGKRLEAASASQPARGERVVDARHHDV